MHTLLDRLNHAAAWRRTIRVGPDRFRACSLDRLAYLAWQKLRGPDPHVFDLVRAGDHVVDIGANLGVYSHRFAHVVGPRGKVTAFEPDPLLYATLCDNIGMNGRHIRALPYAVGTVAARGHLSRGLLNSGNNHLTHAASPTGRPQTDIEIVSLDAALAGEHIDLIKIDVQGWEVEVILGMRQTLAEQPGITLYVEVWPYGLKQAGTTAKALLDLLGYLGLQVSTPSGAPVPSPATLAARATQPFWFTDVVARRPA